MATSAPHGGWVIKRQAIGNASAAIVAGDEELPMAEDLHDRQAVRRHGSFAIGGMFRVTCRRGTRAIAAQISQHEREVCGRLRRNFVPADMRLRIAVQQHERGTSPASTHENLGAFRLDAVLGEAGEEVGDDVHGAPFSRATALQPMSVR